MFVDILKQTTTKILCCEIGQIPTMIFFFEIVWISMSVCYFKLLGRYFIAHICVWSLESDVIRENNNMCINCLPQFYLAGKSEETANKTIWKFQFSIQN